MTKIDYRSAVVILTVAIGAGSMLLLGAFLFFGPLSPVDLGLGRGIVLAWDAALSLAFCLQHSIMVRRSFQRWIEPILSPVYHGALYTIASAVVLFAMVILWQESTIVLVRIEGAARWLARSLFLLTLGGFLWGGRSLGRFDTFGIDAILGREPLQTRLSIRGPYRWIRHPLYLFVLVLMWSYPDLTADRLLLNLIWSIWIVVGSVLEERDLVRVFGEDYREYQRRVPMLLPWKPPSLAKPKGPA
jgi:protein-S-isoprenylcysteine O-methyltransferase Ste14